MDWEMIIERNRERIMTAIAPLLAVLGFDPRRAGEMPRHFYRSLLILLRPVESAVRRLIFIAARGIIVKLKLSASCAFRKGLGLHRDAERVAAFCLIDPLKRFAPEGFEWAEEWGREQVLPRISVPGLFDPHFPDPIPIPSRDDPIDTGALVRRIQALKAALDNLPREAMRLARWKARGELARQSAVRPKRGRLSPFRPGFAPGYHWQEREEIDVILGDCHYFAVEAWRGADTS
jgi:hypothetical protein